MNDVLKALARNEKVKVFYRGELKGEIRSVDHKKKINVEEHPFFGMNQHVESSVDYTMDELRKGRFDDF